MASFLHTLLFFVIALATLIAFHEFGHFWVARKLGVKVIRFSIGFGRPLRRFQKDPHSTEYIIAAVPLGGYVKMVDEREGQVAPEDLPYAFNRQPLWARTAIVAAGPLFNLVLAVLIFWVILVSGESGIRPVLGTIEVDSIAGRAGFAAGDEILGVDGDQTPTWNHAISSLLATVVDKQEIPVSVRLGDGSIANRVLIISDRQAENPNKLMEELGFRAWEPKVAPQINDVLDKSPAQIAGIRAGDRIISVNGAGVFSPNQFVESIRKNPGKSIRVVVERDEMQRTIELIPAIDQSKNGPIGRIGATVGVPPGAMDSMQVEYRLGVLAALGASVQKVVDFSVLTVKMMGKMIVGKASVDNLSGPISIAKYAGESADMGLNHFLKFLAIVSISLGVLNLMPIPILDGGHLLFFLIEAIQGRPLSEQLQMIGQQVGMVLLVCLMALAFMLDIERLIQ